MHRRRLVRLQARHLDGEQARRRVGPLQVRAELEELVRLAARQRRLHDALEGVRRLADAHEERVRRGEHGRGPRARDQQVQPVQELPHLARDLLAHAARVLPRARHARGDRIRVGRVPEHELRDGLRAVVREVLAEQLVAAQQQHEVLPPAPAVGDVRVEQAVEVDVQEAARVLRPLDVAARPVERLCDAAQHQERRTQVSLLPPPCEELTTSEPSRSAARVSPPGTTLVILLESTKGRRSTWAGRSSSR